MPTPHEDILESKRLYEDHRARTQAFFATIALEMRRPSFGERAREVYAPMLLRAQEAGIFTPEVTHG